MVMFALENFIKGLQLSIHSLSITVEEDKIILFRVFYDMEGGEEDKRIVGEIPVSELQAAQDILEQGFLCADSLLFSNNSLEVAVQAFDRLRLPPFRSDRIMYSVSEHDYKFELSKSSSHYIFALFCSFANRSEQHFEFGPIFMRLRSQETLTSLDDLAELCRIQTVKINSPKVHTRSEFRHMLDSYLFNISYNHNITLSVAEFVAEERPFRNNARRSGQLFPYRRYNPELVKYYHQAVATNIPFTQYLAFYHVAEFFFQSISEQDIFQEIENYITRPSFSPHKEGDLRGFYNMVRKKMREQREDGVWNEKTGLLLCLKRFIPDLGVLKDSISSIDCNVLNYYKTSLVEFADESKLINFDDAEDKIYLAIRDRVYSVRNAIVHSKDGEKLRYEPFKHDKQLAKEIPLMRSIAEEIIINSAKSIDFALHSENL